jgi:hypothetical protein
MALLQISLKLPNRPGALASIARLLAEQRINLAAISVDSSGRVGLVRLVVNDPERGERILRDAGYPSERSELIAVQLEDRAGSFLKVLDVLSAAKVNITSVAILVAREGSHSLVALGTDDLKKARRLLRQAGFISEGAEKLVSNADLVSAAPAIPAESVGLLL